MARRTMNASSYRSEMRMRPRALTVSTVIAGAALATAGLVSPAYASTVHAGATAGPRAVHPDGIWWIYEQFPNNNSGDDRCAFTGRGLELSDLINTYSCTPDGSLIDLWINTNTPVGVLGG